MYRRKSEASRPSLVDSARPRRRSWFRSLFAKDTKDDIAITPARTAVSTQRVSPLVETMTTAEDSDRAASPWFDGLLLVCFAYLDGATLVQCERVATEWHAAAQGPTLYGAQYCAMWRNGVALPAALASAFSRDQLKRFCRERATVPLELCTRASWWIQDDRTAYVDNVVLEDHRSDTMAIRVNSALRSLGLSRPPTAIAWEAHKDGVCYFEAAIQGRGSVGVAEFHGNMFMDQYNDGLSSAHVGWWHGSYGYNGFDGNLYWRDDASLRDQRFGAYGPSWGYQRSELTPPDERFRTITIGCGLDVANGQLFFTKNGEFLGYAPVQVQYSSHRYCAAVSLENRADTAVLNLGRAPFVFDIEVFLAERATSPAAALMRAA